MSSLGSAIFAHLETGNSIDVYPRQLPNKVLTGDTDVAVTYNIMAGEGPIPTNDVSSVSDTRTERVRVQFSVWSRDYLTLETTARLVVRLLDRVSQATWGTVLIQASRVVGWLDEPLEPDTSIFQRIIDAEIMYNEVP